MVQRRKTMKQPSDSVTRFSRPSKKTVLLVVATVAATILLSTIFSLWLSRSSNLKVPSIGTIRTFGVKAFWDSSLKNETTEIQWGTIYSGSSSNVSIYLQSISNLEAALQLNTSNWEPFNMSRYMNLTWNYNQTTLGPDEVIQVTLTLTTSSSPDFIQYLITNDVREFSFDILISIKE